VSREINVAVRSLDSNRVKHLIQLLGTSQGRKATLNKRLVVVHPSEDRAGAFLNLSSQREPHRYTASALEYLEGFQAVGQPTCVCTAHIWSGISSWLWKPWSRRQLPAARGAR
jgi:hypothetical protein